MALNANVLSELIRTKINARLGVDISDPAVDVWDAVAEALVEHVQGAAQVVVTVTGVTVGGASAPGTGTIS